MLPIKCECCNNTALYVIHKENPKGSVHLYLECVKKLPKEEREGARPFLS